MDFGCELYIKDIGPNRTKVLAFLKARLKLSPAQTIVIPSELPFKVFDGGTSETITLKRELELLGCNVGYSPS